MDSPGCLIDKILKIQGILCSNINMMSENTSPSLQILKWENAKRNTQILLPQLLSWETTILLSSKAMLLSKTSHELSDQRQDFFFFFFPLPFFKVTSWPLVLYTFGISSEMHIHWVWSFFRRCWTLPPPLPTPYLGLCKRNRRPIGISSEANIQTAVWGLQLLKV